VSTDADANRGPVLDLYRNSASPAADDVLGEIKFHGENDADEKIQYGLIAAKLQDASDGTEDVRLSFKTIVAGTERERITIQPTEVVFNEDSVDLDFRVESNGNANMLFVDAAEDKVFIGHNTTHQYDAYGAEIILQIEAAGTAPHAGIGMIQNSNDADSAPLIFGKSRGTSVGSTTIVQDGDLLGRIEFQGMDGGDLETGASIFGMVDGTPGSDDMPGRLVFNTTADGANSATERMRIDSSGNLLVGKTTIATGTAGIALRSNGEVRGTVSGAEAARFSRLSSDGAIIGFEKDGSGVGTIGAVNGNIKVSAYGEEYASLSGTSVTISCTAGNNFALTTSGNTTFTFSNVPTSGTAFGFTLKLTSGGSHTITYPNSVDFAGATAPDAPASGETDVLVFYTVDGGTNWYGALAIDAAG
jgi:hypothetical protein